MVFSLSKALGHEKHLRYKIVLHHIFLTVPNSWGCCIGFIPRRNSNGLPKDIPGCKEDLQESQVLSNLIADFVGKARNFVGKATSFVAEEEK